MPTDAVDSRARGGRAWGALLSAQEFAGLAGAGFEPVGAVMGTAVVHLGYVSQGGRCSASTVYARTDLASAMTGPVNQLLRKRNGMRRMALSRAVEQCEELGGDGIVGISLSITPFPAGGTEFTIRGTAVRARGPVRPAVPFTTHVSGQELASLLRAGWAPCALVFGIAIGTRHDDSKTSSRTPPKQYNYELRTYTELIGDTRRDARVQLEGELAKTGADGVVVSGLTLELGERECPGLEGTRDFLAEATILGTSIVSFGQGAGEQAPLSIMRLDSRTVRPLVSPPAARPEPEGEPDGGAEPEKGTFFDRYLSARAARRASRGGFASSDSSGISRKGD
ncbi:MAG TPA: heavy metal-binding domain-containing protein [Streptosporangiaceae bacterium]|nr:heavy metal-binding domain-containing protein [Streptosporangiaceae bacterium]